MAHKDLVLSSILVVHEIVKLVEEFLIKRIKVFCQNLKIFLRVYQRDYSLQKNWQLYNNSRNNGRQTEFGEFFVGWFNSAGAEFTLVSNRLSFICNNKAVNATILVLFIAKLKSFSVFVRNICRWVYLCYLIHLFLYGKVQQM